jgi:beta-N-acetylhexosaminidase
MFRTIAVVPALLTVFATAVLVQGQPQLAGPVHLDAEGEKWAQDTLRKLSPEEKVGQLFVIRVRVEMVKLHSPGYWQLCRTIHKYHLGSLALSARVEGPVFYGTKHPLDPVSLLNNLQAESGLPLLIAADFERGVPARLFGTTVFPHAMAFGAAGKLSYAEQFGRVTAQESRALGVHWNLFPVADVNANPANPIINTRAFGEDPEQVADLVAAYIHGARANGMLTTAKHFPGHGETATDSHLGVPALTSDEAHILSVDLPPFRRAIEAGVDAIMTAHVRAPALDPDPHHLATTSTAIVTGLLKDRLDFKGLVVTDALDMASLTRLYAPHVGRAAVDAFKAGNDVLLVPADLGASYNAVLASVRSGEIAPARLDSSVLKILRVKASLGLDRRRLVDEKATAAALGRRENLALGQQISDDAITLVRDNGKLIPLGQAKIVRASLSRQGLREEVHTGLVEITFSDDVRAGAGRILERQIRTRMPHAEVIYIDPRIAARMSETVLRAVDRAQTVVVAGFVIPTPRRVVKAVGGLDGSVSFPPDEDALLNKILDHAAERTVVLAMGNPYLLTDFPAIQNYICAFSNATVSEISVAKALFGEIPMHGHLPVSIPNFAVRGGGIERPAENARRRLTGERRTAANRLAAN